jgi:hypothetical protein
MTSRDICPRKKLPRLRDPVSGEILRGAQASEVKIVIDRL